jgi:hypothetical protein
MKSNTLVIKLGTSAIRNIQMCKAGISPRAMAIKPGTRVERNRRKEQRLGHVKHKALLWA